MSVAGLRALVTNDDGIDSPGLWALAAAARDAGMDVVVAAPHRDASGTGTSVLSVREGHRTAVHPRRLPGLANVPAWAVEGHPAFIVHSAGRGWLDPAPDIVLSGINPGANVGRMVMHSGTVGAALAATIYGWRALAVSLDVGWKPPEFPHWEAAVSLLPTVLEALVAAPPGTVFSLNVPDRPVSELKELREARLAEFGSVHLRVDHRVTDDGDAMYSTVQTVEEPPEPGTDTALLAEGHPTLTELVPVAARPGALDRLAGTRS